MAFGMPIDVDGHEKMACDATLRMHAVMKDLTLKEKKKQNLKIKNT